MKYVKIILLTGALLALLSGCGKSNKGLGQIDSYPADYIEDTKAVQIVDIREGQYEEPLNIQFDEEEVDALVEATKGAEIDPESSDSTALYKLLLKDKKGEVIDEWFIDGDRNITSTSGRLNVNGGWLEEIESKHGLTYDKIFNRKPGAHYFDDMEELDYGDVSVISENNVMDGVSYVLKKDDIKTLRSVPISVKGDKKSNIDLLARITLYDADEMELHTIDIAKDGSLYCNNWPLQGSEFEHCINDIKAKSGL